MITDLQRENKLKSKQGQRDEDIAPSNRLYFMNTAPLLHKYFIFTHMKRIKTY